MLSNANISSNVLEDIAEHPKLVKLVGEATHSILRSEISIEQHEKIMKQYTKNSKEIKKTRAALQDSIFPLNADESKNNEFNRVLYEVISNIGRHGNGTSGHSYSCKETAKGKIACRYGKPSPCMNEMCSPILLCEEEIENDIIIENEKIEKIKNKKDLKTIKKYKISIIDTSQSFPPKITFSYHKIGHNPMKPFQPSDERILLWCLQKREIQYPNDVITRVKEYLNHLKENKPMYDENDIPGPIKYHDVILMDPNINGTIVDHNPSQTLSLLCNTSTNWLGSKEQSKYALFYVSDYFAKDGIEVKNALVAAHSAYRLCQRFPVEDIIIDEKDKLKQNDNDKEKNEDATLENEEIKNEEVSNK